MSAARAMPDEPLRRESFGRTADGTEVELFTLVNAGGLTARIATFGGVVVSLETRDRAGRLDDVVLGYDDVAGYEGDTSYFGAIIGRCANRIARGRFTLDGTTHQLPVNNGPNHLHGGLRAFHRAVWSASPFERAGERAVALTHRSPDGDEGYPGTVLARVTYTLTDADELIVDYQATADRATPVNLTQHSYFNLAGTSGHGAPAPVLDHELTIHASRTTPVDETLIPTGALAPVEGTPFDFRAPTRIGARIGADDAQLKHAGGYDHNWVLDRRGDGLAHAARVTEPTTGRTLDVWTTEPGLQFYSGNFLDGSARGKGGRPYGHRTGLCLETQHFPDSPNHPEFPSVVLRPGATYRSRTVFAFGAE